MKNATLNRLKQLGLAVLGAYVMTGCPSTQSVGTQSNNGLLVGNPQEVIAQEHVAQPAIAQAASAAPSDPTVADAIEFEVCAAADWHRPSDAEQAKQLGSDARYSAATEAGALKRASSQFWSHEVISFTTYGLSARMEPVNLTGVWTVADDLWSCYAPETTVAINQGDLAEAWLLNQQITGLEWSAGRYIMTVAPAPTGMQVVQFDRVDGQEALPLDVVSESGSSVAVLSGDWQ